MIDLEFDVYDTVSARVRAAHPGVHVKGEYENQPPRFPAVSIEQKDNRVYQRMRTDRIENAAVVMFECNVYSDKVSGAKKEAKAIAETLDEAFADCGFTRTMSNPVGNLRDASIYRLFIRYQAIIGTPNAEGKYLIYQNE